MRRIPANDHCASRISRCPPILCHTSDTYPVWLERKGDDEYMGNTETYPDLFLLTLLQSTPSTKALVRSFAFTVTFSTPSTYT